MSMTNKKDMDAFVARMAAGRAAAGSARAGTSASADPRAKVVSRLNSKPSRASSNAPPSAPKPKKTKAAAPNPPSAPNTNEVVGESTKIPAPAAASHIHIHLHTKGD